MITAIQSKILDVANAPGELAKGLELLADGKFMTVRIH